MKIRKKLMMAAACILLSACRDDTPVQQETVTVLDRPEIRLADETAPEPAFECQNAPVIDCKDYKPISPDALAKGRQDVYRLARLAMAEAESEGLYGKAAVVKVALNRMGSLEFPDTVPEVIYQPDQFTSIWDGRYDSVEPDEECLVAVEMVMEGWSCPAVDEALYFSTPESSGWHKAHLEYTGSVGAHEFYK